MARRRGFVHEEFRIMTSGEHCSRCGERADAPRDCATSTGLLYLLASSERARLFEEEKKEESIFTPRCNLLGITRDEFPSVRKRETRSLKVTSVLSFKSPDPPIYSIPLVREHSIYLVQSGLVTQHVLTRYFRRLQDQRVSNYKIAN